MTAPRESRGGPTRAPGGPSPVRGAVLIGLAVIVGVIGLQVIDDSGRSGPSSPAVTTPGSATTTPAASTAAPAKLRPASQVRVKVYNASAVQGRAGAMTDKLKGEGYNTQTPGTLATTTTGTQVQCRAGFEKEAVVLATFGIGNGATVQPFPKNPPAGAGDADCLVILGKQQ